MARIRINTRTHTNEKPYLINSFVFFSKLVRQNKSIGWAKYMYVGHYMSERCVEGIFVTFPWWLINVKSGSKIGLALFSNEHHFEIWFSKKKTITFFWSKLSKLHKKRPNFACDNYIFPYQNKQCTHSKPLKGAICPFKNPICIVLSESRGVSWVHLWEHCTINSVSLSQPH